MDAIKADSDKASLGDNSDRLARIETIRQRTISLRKAQTENWLIGELSRDDRWNLQESEEVDDGTGGKQTVHRTTVVTVDNADTGVPGEDSISKYQGINFPATFEKSGNKAKIQDKKLNSGEDFETWVSFLPPMY
ncbi:hypothetical protein N7478_003703 [Penicillium angulare]|uniref:uncharacterized protein n=1 Tax=Penicillium angulare TaxID=116970 RepID=UPI00253FCEE7|nr:uncharacterized protein N7478_003703 [Penicillium angulare]KAJ5288017.1 hypothetical protein N7478_003703 [Penicillium angulare]